MVKSCLYIQKTSLASFKNKAEIRTKIIKWQLTQKEKVNYPTVQQSKSSLPYTNQSAVLCNPKKIVNFFKLKYFTAFTEHIYLSVYTILSYTNYFKTKENSLENICYCCYRLFTYIAASASRIHMQPEMSSTQIFTAIFLLESNLIKKQTNKHRDLTI